MIPEPSASTGGAASAYATLLDPVPPPPSGGYIACFYDTELYYLTKFQVNGAEYPVGETVPLAPGKYNVSFTNSGSSPAPQPLKKVVVTSGNVTVILVNYEGPPGPGAVTAKSGWSRKPPAKKKR